MATFDFELILGGVGTITEDHAEKLFSAGCDDGTPARINGVPVISFSREGNNQEEAVVSAIRAVVFSGIGATVEAVTDFAGQPIKSRLLDDVLALVQRREPAGA